MRVPAAAAVYPTAAARTATGATTGAGFIAAGLGDGGGGNAFTSFPFAEKKGGRRGRG